MIQFATFLRKNLFKTAAAILVLTCAARQDVLAQGKRLKVLFVGDAFTANNDLPNMIDRIARMMGDTLDYDTDAPAVFSLQDHAMDAGTTGKISAGYWNHVVLQEQSPLAALSDADAAAKVYPYARWLDSLADDKNKCNRTVFYMTWGYPDGDASNCAIYPPICTYKGMDSVLMQRYMEMAVANEAIVSPVGQVFKEIMTTMPSINLFAPDRRHPSGAGTYAAALTFYSVLFRRDPMSVPYDYTLVPPEAIAVKRSVLTVCYSFLPKWFVGMYDPKVGFTAAVVANDVTFNSSTSLNVVNYHWDFGDGGTSTDANPLHRYAAVGKYHVTLYGDNCSLIDSAKRDIDILSVVSVGETSLAHSLRMYPNPAGSVLNLEADPALLRGAEISISNLLGLRIMTVPYTGTALQIGQLAPGMYTVNIRQASGETTTSKFVKQ